jgi:hypothetical protein
VRAVDALESSGVTLNQLADALAAEQLSFAYLDYVMQPPRVVDQTHDGLCAELGVAFEVLERVYLAWGLPQPLRDERVTTAGRRVAIVPDSREKSQRLVVRRSRS